MALINKDDVVPTPEEVVLPEKVLEEKVATEEVKSEEVVQVEEKAAVVEAPQAAVSAPVEAVTTPAAPATPVTPQNTGKEVGGSITTGPSTPAVKAEGESGMQKFSESGFEGLSLGFGAFPYVSLPAEGRFRTGEDRDLGSAFDGRIQSTREKFIFKNGLAHDDEKFFYSYDKITTIGGDPVQPILDEWKAAGLTPVIKDYLDVAIMIEAVEDDETMGDLVGTFVMASIPKTSISRLSGVLKMQEFRTGQMPDEFITRFSCGEKVTKVKHPFYPWAFSIVG